MIKHQIRRRVTISSAKVVRDPVLEVHCVLGTRPEAIKVAPVVHALSQDARFRPKLISTGQHRELLIELLDILELKVDLNLEIMVPGQTPAHVLGTVVARLAEYWRDRRPHAVLVQGDTATACGAALAAWYERIPVGHIEAGLRTYDDAQPFPEEKHRVIIAQLASMHFCPTNANRDNLISEGVEPDRIFVTGNTGIDSFLKFWRQVNGASQPTHDFEDRRTILVTAHRRENHGDRLVELCLALTSIVERDPGVRVILPVHPNPSVRDVVDRLLRCLPQVSVIDPPRYDRFVKLMAEADLLITDSGGIQEEACSVGKATLLIRNVTERQEGVRSGPIRIVGTRASDIRDAVSEVLYDPRALDSLSCPSGCFGDGHASSRIVESIRHLFFHSEKPADFRPASQPSAATAAPLV